jgi:hypothetical protein
MMPGKVGMISGLFLVLLLEWEVWVRLSWGIWLIKPV